MSGSEADGPEADGSGRANDDRGGAADPADREVRSVVLSLVVGVFLGGLGGGVAFPTLPALGPLLGISPLLVGLILSLNRFTRLLMNTPAGQLMDSMGTRRPMVAGFFVQATAPFGYALGLDPAPLPVDSATVFLASRAAWGVGSAFVFVGAFSTITHVTTPANRGRWVGYMRGGQSLGFPAGLVLGGVLTDVYGYAVAFLAAGVAGLLAGVVAFLVLPNVDADVDARSHLRDLPRVVAADRRILAVGTVNFVVRFLYAGVLLSTVVLYAERNGVGLGSLSGVGASGVIMAVSIGFMSVATLLVGRASDSLASRTALTLPSLTVLGVGFVVLGVWPTLSGTLLGVALAGTGVGATSPPLLAYLGDISPEGDVGKLGGVYNVFGDLGSTLGPLVSLPLASVVTIGAEYLGCAALVVATGALVATTLRGDDGRPSAVPADD